MPNYGTQSARPFYSPRINNDLYKKTKEIVRVKKQVRDAPKIDSPVHELKTPRMIEMALWYRSEYLKRLAQFKRTPNYSESEIQNRLENGKTRQH